MVVNLGQQHNVGEKPAVMFVFLNKKQNAPRPSEHPPVRGKNVKTFRLGGIMLSSHLFWTSSSLYVPAGVTQQQEEDHTGLLIHLPSAVRTLIFLAGRIQLFPSLVDREVEFCVLTI